MSATRIAKRTGVGLLALLAASQLIRPARTNPPSDPRKMLVATEHPPADMVAVLDRTCHDCHTNSTRWPWYTNVAPISWWIVDHVNEGRRRASFSDWADYDAPRRFTLCETAKLVGVDPHAYQLGALYTATARPGVITFPEGLLGSTVTP